LEKQVKGSPAFGKVLADSIEFCEERYNFRNRDYCFVRKTLRKIRSFLTLGKYFK
jgi:hypothetical protein